MAARYNPPTRVVRVEVPYLTIVQQADPDWNYHKHHEVEYEGFANGRVFYADPYRRGAYHNPHQN